ncbi:MULTISPECIES: S49 family peptidase [unclassified Acidovorax]|uniref:S49 family peptidase n=1 Tax=unclassified Acidovorax TaxID=2684926 RepID=UPI001C443261|nr:MULTISPECIES: S49 family peptidase [unclassified Acidovorax]MBV7459483.1 S49 family peptidase [Acidovorax sp. sif0632]MBV7464508.1 S49 family peptidase [Acidovorax sp. sif0613]
MTLLDLITGAWAIEPDKLREIQAIYATHLRGEKIDIAAIEARLGRPLSSEQQAYTVEPGGVAVLRMSGVIAPKANLFMQVSGGLSTQMATKQLESAIVDARVRSTILALDTPGGSVIGTPEMAAAVHELAKTKPIVTHSDGALASAGYWIGSAANAVYVSGPTVQAGSIGVVIDRTFNPNSALREESIVAGRYKRLVKSNEPLSDEARAIVQADVDYVYSLFVDAVAQYRDTTAQQVLDRMADGRVFRGQQAIDAGLVDGVSTLDALVESMATDPAKYTNRRKAVFAVAALPSPSAGAAPKDTTTTREKEPVMADPDNKTPITRASFEQDHAPLFAQLRGEFLALGATQERERIQAVLALDAHGEKELINTLAFDGKTSAGDAALAVLKAQAARTSAAAAQHQQDAPPAAPGSASAAPTNQGEDTDRSLGKRAAAAFNELRGR